jgi:hypothetical protein
LWRFSVQNRQWSDGTIQLQGLAASHVGHDVDFQVVGHYFYAISNMQRRYDCSDSKSSYYECYRFPVLSMESIDIQRIEFTRPVTTYGRDINPTLSLEGMDMGPTTDRLTITERMSVSGSRKRGLTIHKNFCCVTEVLCGGARGLELMREPQSRIRDHPNTETHRSEGPKMFDMCSDLCPDHFVEFICDRGQFQLRSGLHRATEVRDTIRIWPPAKRYDLRCLFNDVGQLYNVAKLAFWDGETLVFARERGVSSTISCISFCPYPWIRGSRERSVEFSMPRTAIRRIHLSPRSDMKLTRRQRARSYKLMDVRPLRRSPRISEVGAKGGILL